MFAAWYVFPFHPHCECVYITSVPVRSSIHIWFWAKVTNWPSEWATSTGSPSRTNTSELLPLMWVPSNNLPHRPVLGRCIDWFDFKKIIMREPSVKTEELWPQYSVPPPVSVIMNRWKIARLAAVSQCVYLTLESIDLLCCSAWNWPLKHTMSQSDWNATT